MKIKMLILEYDRQDGRCFTYCYRKWKYINFDGKQIHKCTFAQLV